MQSWGYMGRNQNQKRGHHQVNWWEGGLDCCNSVMLMASRRSLRKCFIWIIRCEPIWSHVYEHNWNSTPSSPIERHQESGVGQHCHNGMWCSSICCLSKCCNLWLSVTVRVSVCVYRYVCVCVLSCVSSLALFNSHSPRLTRATVAAYYCCYCIADARCLYRSPYSPSAASLHPVQRAAW